jgi:hypothetical protein
MRREEEIVGGTGAGPNTPAAYVGRYHLEPKSTCLTDHPTKSATEEGREFRERERERSSR